MIRIENIHKWFMTQHVLQGVNLEIQEGETLVIIGQSGCGKSVLLKHMLGLLEPDHGEIYLRDKPLTSLANDDQGKFRLQFGMVFQGAALFDSLTVGENVGFSLAEHTQFSKKEIEKKVSEKLGLVGLDGIESKMPSELSGGMRKRVGLARAICNEPGIVLYDEPTTGLDPINADSINDLIISLQKRLSVTSIVVTHDMTSAYKIANRIAMLYQGKIIAVGTPDEIKNSTNPIVEQFVTGSAKGPIQ